jgi:hypothetical protein
VGEATVTNSALTHVTPPEQYLLAITVGPDPLQTTPDPRARVYPENTATGYYLFGTYDISLDADWSTDNAAVATILTGLITDPDGMQRVGRVVQGVQVGTATARATIGETTASGEVQVLAPHVESIAITPNRASIAKGLTQSLSAVATYTDGSTRDVTSEATWSSETAGVAAVSTSGVVTGTGVGLTTLGATLGGVAGTARLRVTPAELVSLRVAPANATVKVKRTLQYSVAGVYTDGSTQDFTAQATWSSSNKSVATISASGLAKGVKRGPSTVTAAVGTRTGTTGLTVTNQPV